MITIITTIECRNECIDFVKKELCKLVPNSLMEFGCVTYNFYQDEKNLSFFHSYEKWISQEDIDKHLKTKSIENYFKNTKGMITNFIIREMKSIC